MVALRTGCAWDVGSSVPAAVPGARHAGEGVQLPGLSVVPMAALPGRSMLLLVPSLSVMRSR